MEKLMSLQVKWAINRVHFKDLNLDNLCKNRAYVLNDYKEPIMVPFYHVMKIKDHLFILHDKLEHLHKAGNMQMTVSHLKTGQALMHFTRTEKEKMADIEKRAINTLNELIGRLSELYVMDRIKSGQALNMKYNIYGY